MADAHHDAELQELLDSLPLAYVASDLAGRIVQWNRRYVELTGLAPDAAVGAVLAGDVLRTHASRALYARGRAEIREGRGFVGEAEELGADGERLVFRVHASPIRSADGAIVGSRALAEDVTELRRLERALAESEARFRDLFDHAPVAYAIFDRRGRQLSWNRRSRELSGRSEEELRAGRTIFDFAKPTPERLATLRRVEQAVFVEGRETEIEIEELRPDGSSYWVRSILAPLRDAGGAVVAVRSISEDVTEMRATQRALRESEERLRALFDATSEGIAAYDAADGAIVLFNRAAEHILRCSAREALGSPVLRFCTPESAEALSAAVAWLEREENSGRTYFGPAGLRARRADGSEFEHEATLTKMSANGRALYFIVFRDLEERRRLEREHAVSSAYAAQLQEEIKAAHDFESIVGQSRALADTLAQVARVAPTEATVLILGETGSGKELIARAVHARSARAGRPLVKLNCAALPSGLIESELFGHERGAFTGASERRVGRFELADGGTLFLDEVGELPPDVQAKLLRVLQEREFERVGGTQTRRSDVRLIAATNRDLEQAVAAGRFRADLYYRLNVFPVRLPPLRERGDDIVLLARFFLQRFAAKLGRPVARIAPETVALLVAYPWPGNVRELENVVERALILASGDTLRIAPEMLPLPSPASPAAPAAAANTPPRTLAAAQREHILAALSASRWKVAGAAGAAAALGMSESTLRSQMQRLGIRRPV